MLDTEVLTDAQTHLFQQENYISQTVPMSNESLKRLLILFNFMKLFNFRQTDSIRSGEPDPQW
jgi:hypothetical protein